ncbi:MAG: M20/M25/M40 family metallo-hydrolase [Planctomycetota bacterium]|nr:M20/M25/M40 family metallo-hydrolase [Planctomycetota bacterium]
MLGANACYLEALRTLHEHGFEPAGDLIVAFVVGGPEEGLGTRKLLEGIPGASRFILGRPTGLAVRACPSEFHVGSEAPRAMAAAHLAAAGAPSTAEHYGKLESWDADAMLLAKAGWDGAVYGPGDRGDDPSGQRVAIASLATAARVYAAASVKLAGTAHGFGAPLQVTESRAHRRTRLESPPWARSLR